MNTHNIKIASWNIQGLKSRLRANKCTLGDTKLKIQSVQQELKKFDIICLQETWLKEENSLDFSGYKVYQTVHKTILKRGCRGVAIFVKDYLFPATEEITSPSPNILWCKINGAKLGVTKDIYIASVYVPPLNCQSKTGEDVLYTLEKEIMKYEQKGQIIILGDLNARTSILTDHVENDNNNTTLPLYNYVSDTPWPSRNNSDKSINKQGQAVINLCIAHRLRILNGRTIGDFEGKLTCYQRNGASTVDYAIICNSLRKDILGFAVNQLTPYSDHCLISLKLAISNSMAKIIDNQTKQQKQKSYNKKKTLIRFKWSEESKIKYQSTLQTTEIGNMLNKQLSNNDTTNIDDKLNNLNIIIQTVAQKSLRKQIFQTKKTKDKNKKNTKKWYTDECRVMKQKLKVFSKTINADNYNSNRNEYWRLKKQYKKLIKKAHRQYKNNIVSTMANSLNNVNRSDLWKELKKLKSQEQESNNTISEEQWINHFKGLLYENNDSNIPEDATLPTQDCIDTNILNSKISESEIHDQINKLKCKKTPGIDGISNEMIKYGRFKLVPVIKQIFNDILSSGQFPKEWNNGLIKAIYKKGDHSLPSNYRGITLTSCLGKLFTSILQTRLLNFLEMHKLLKEEQFGFRPNCRTTDNLFILKQLIHKYFARKEKLYVCFIDYEKAFDSVWHKGLLYKIRNIGVSGNFYRTIESMYSSITSSVLTCPNNITESFECNKGIRQGDGLSPILFSIFMNDIPDYLRKQGCKGVELNKHSFNSLMFADDLMLLSSSPLDLQHSINVISQHAEDWQLKLNIKKPKIVIFNKQGPKTTITPQFRYREQIIEITDKQTYLGLTLTSSGRFNCAREELVKKGFKVLAMIRRMLSNCDFIPVQLYCKLFDILIKPVILYGSEIWGPELIQLKTPFDKNAIEQFHLKFCKNILGLPWYTANSASRAELGRFPLVHDIKSNIFGYYLRLKYNVKNTLLKHAFHYSITHNTDFQKAYKSIPSNCTDFEILEGNNKIKLMRKQTLKSLHNLYIQEWTKSTFLKDHDKIKLRGKYLKTNYNFEQYLLSIKHPAHRIALTKMRLGIHKLRIQTGKYEDNGKQIPIEQRLCKLCSEKQVENEEHFIGHCSVYSNSRSDFFQQISSIDPSFEKLQLVQKIQYVLTAEKSETSPIIGKFIASLNHDRQQSIYSSNLK